MTVIINGSGTANGISYFSSPTTFGGTLATASRGISNASVPAGSVLQVVQTFKSDTWTGSGLSFSDITGFAATITPSSTSSKILAIVYCGKFSTVGTTWYTHAIRLTRNGTAIGIADAAGSRVRSTVAASGYDSPYDNSFSFQYLDSPSSTSALTYQVQVATHGSGTTFCLNRTEGDSDTTNNYDCRTASNVILMEIAA